MHRPALLTLLLSLIICLVVSGCGSSPEPRSRATTRPASYFTSADTAAINKPAAAAQRAAARATSGTQVAACNKVVAYPAWRACWHRLLDPYATALSGLAGVFTSLQTRDFPAACDTQLERAHGTFLGFATRVRGQATGFDSLRRATRARAARTYGTTLDGITKGFTQPFRDVTQVCYSPETLASLNARPSPSASSSP